MTNLLTFCKRLSCFATFVVAVSGASLASAETALTVIDTSGNVIVELNDDDLLAMSQLVIVTANEFVDGTAEFSGPLARDIVALLGAEVETVILGAANDYSVEVPVADFTNYDVIFAMFQNGVQLSPRDKGPIWVIYPMSEHIELQDRVYNDRLIWQLMKVTAK